MTHRQATKGSQSHPTESQPSSSESTGNKGQKGQFYTVNHSYILEGLFQRPAGRIVEPFAGQGDLIDWLAKNGVPWGTAAQPIEAYDIEPKPGGNARIIQRDTLTNPPDYENAWVLTNPPFLARNKCPDKAIFDQYGTNDLYKCFILSLTQQPKCAGGVFILPSGFFLSSRDIDVRCRDAFLSQYRLLRVKYFEESVFPDTATTVVAFSFEKSSRDEPLIEQEVEWISCPSMKRNTFRMFASTDWIIGGDIYHLPTPPGIQIRRFVAGQKLREGEQITSMTLSALDSGTRTGRIALKFREGYVYPAKECSRTYATLCIQGRVLSADAQRRICAEFGEFLEEKRDRTWSLFLPQFRESKEYARKRIPFKLAYSIVLHLIGKMT